MRTVHQMSIPGWCFILIRIRGYSPVKRGGKLIGKFHRRQIKLGREDKPWKKMLQFVAL